MKSLLFPVLIFFSLALGACGKDEKTYVYGGQADRVINYQVPDSIVLKVKEFTQSFRYPDFGPWTYSISPNSKGFDINFYTTSSLPAYDWDKQKAAEIKVDYAKGEIMNKLFNYFEYVNWKCTGIWINVKYDNAYYGIFNIPYYYKLLR